METTTDNSVAVLETLRARGWSFGDLDEVRGVIMISSALADDPSSVVDSVELELLNMDLRSFGGKSLPEPSLLRKSSRILGPIVLQISSVRDISRSSLDGMLKASSGHRLLRFGLSDGHSEITAIEYSHIPSVLEDIPPGTKVRLENKSPVYGGIVCLSSKGLTVLGGMVPTLYEEWKMNQKYSGLSRASVRLSQGGDVDGPPPFEKLQVGAPRKFSQKEKSSYQQESSSKSNTPTADSGNIGSKSTTLQQSIDVKATNSVNSASGVEKLEEKPSSSETRPKEVVEAVPVQNQAASQKLLHKMSQQDGNHRHFNNRKHRGKGRMEDPVVYTLEEYERRKSGTNQIPKNASSYTSHDEQLAWQLQNQFDLEDSHVQESASRANAEHLRMSIFNYERDTYTAHDGGRGRGRGGGRGRRGRGRGRGRYF
ncbi:tudor domain-containing protein 3 [Momordica charantia]|uniref:Tudor domain-containing protein 3 n=1 Tax=Momordica charantia TaxID=3673 RepID=A0A6J1CVD2_MOMCH|nr:tudor domain-containing protein 3 [Momordica charantia]